MCRRTTQDTSLPAGLEVDVSFEDADHDLDDAITQEYRRKYGRSSAVEHTTSPKAQATTLRIVRS